MEQPLLTPQMSCDPINGNPANKNAPWKKLLLVLLILLLQTGCALPFLQAFSLFAFIVISDNMPGNLTDRDSVVDLYRENEEAFLKAAETGSFEDLKDIFGVSDVHVNRDYVDIYCGGTGMAPSSSYYGIFYSEGDDLCALDVAPGDSSALTERNGGFSWEESGGDNSYYVEPLGNHYFYYEAHF